MTWKDPQGITPGARYVASDEPPGETVANDTAEHPESPAWPPRVGVNTPHPDDVHPNAVDRDEFLGTTLPETLNLIREVINQIQRKVDGIVGLHSDIILLDRRVELLIAQATKAT